MSADKPKTDESQGRAKKNDPAGTVSDASCRCKETAKMSPAQLLKLMARDLTSWVRSKKE